MTTPKPETIERAAVPRLLLGLLWCIALSTGIHVAVILGLPWHLAVAPIVGILAAKLACLR